MKPCLSMNMKHMPRLLSPQRRLPVQPLHPLLQRPLHLHRLPRLLPPVQASPLRAPMPGNILDIRVSQGEAVKAGQTLVILEAMKMENEIVAPRDGVVNQITTSKGATVDTGATLVVLG